MKPEILFEDYKHLAQHYAQKVHGFEVLGFEYKDLIQEFQVKIITTIETYLRTWEENEKCGMIPPMPFNVYLMASLNNFKKDMFAKIQKANALYASPVSIEVVDIGTSANFSTQIEKFKFTVQGVDLLEGLETRDKLAATFFLQGYPLRDIKKKSGYASFTKLETFISKMKKEWASKLDREALSPAVYVTTLMDYN